MNEFIIVWDMRVVCEFRKGDKYTINKTNALELMVNQFELGTNDNIVSLWDNSLNVNKLNRK